MRTKPSTYALLGDLTGVPTEYVREVAETKRFLERWTMDPSFKVAFDADPQAALTSLGVHLTPEQAWPHIDPAEATRITAALAAGDPLPCAPSVLAYRAFIAEKLAHRTELRARAESTDPRLSAWRRRQIHRVSTELGVQRADAIVHAPLSIELSKGCTVGCWFCGVAAPKFDHNFPYTEEHAVLWRGVLQVLAETAGPVVRDGFLYWATDPLDNPEYESFLTDFHDVLGRCPQTTTAQGPKDIDRTRALLQLTHSLGSSVDRFSIIALNHLHRLHEAFTAVEMLRIECVPQNKEASGQHRKSNSGRARTFAAKRSGELVTEDSSSTIACVSGFLMNMVDRRVQLITPCDASDRWPLGYWVLAERTFTDAEDLRVALEEMIAESVRSALTPADVITLRKDLSVVEDADRIVLTSRRGLRVVLGAQSDGTYLAGMLSAGDRSAEDIALARWNANRIPLSWTYALLGSLFDRGLLDEEPAARSFESVMRRPSRASRKEPLPTPLART